MGAYFSRRRARRREKLYKEMSEMNRAAEEAQRKHMAAIEAREAQHRLRLEQQVVLVQARRRGQLGRRYASRRRNELKAL